MATNQQLALSKGSNLPRWVDNRLVEIVLLIAITGLAAALRFYKLGEWSFWIDEVFTVGRVEAHYSTVEDALQNLPPNFLWTPVSLLLTSGVFSQLGVSEWSARLMPALIGIVSVPVLYIPVRKLLGVGVGLVFALLLALAPWHIYWSQNARFYTSLMLFYSMALFVVFYFIERDSLGHIILFLLLFYIALSERLTAGFLFPVVTVYLLILIVGPFEKPAGLRRRNLAILAIFALIIVTFEVVSFIRTGDSTVLNLFNNFEGRPIDDPGRLVSFIAFKFGFPLLITAVVGGIYLIFQRNRLGLYLSVASFLPIALLIAISPFVFTKDRYVFMILPTLIILASVAVNEIFQLVHNSSNILAASMLFLLIFTSLSSLLLYYTINNGNRRDWKGAFELIKQKDGGEDIVVSTRPELVSYYLGQETPWMGDISPIEVIESNHPYWFVSDSESVWVTGEIQSWVKENADLIDVRMLRVPEDISLRTYYYQPTMPKN